jgi:hypothetical protein
MYNTEILEEQAISLPIAQAGLRIAREFADQQPTEAKKRQVYLNTLAVWVVNDYLAMMDIPTELARSDSWNSAMRLYADVADLKLTQLGSLECRPVQFGTFCYIPLEVPDDRIGVVVVRIDLEQQEACLLGFTKIVEPGELPLHQLQPIDELLKHIDRKQNEVNLSQWLQNIFEPGWQPIEEILVQKTPIFAFRNQIGIMRGKSIDLGIKPLERSLILIVTLQSKSPEETQIAVQLYPNTESIYLPENLAIKILDEEDTPVMEALTKAKKSRIKLDFIARLGERFSLQLEWENASMTEHFVV